MRYPHTKGIRIAKRALDYPSNQFFCSLGVTGVGGKCWGIFVVPPQKYPNTLTVMEIPKYPGFFYL